MIGIDNKGQISAEYLLVIVVLLLIMGTFTIPLVQSSVNASNDVSWTSDARIAVDSITNAVNVVYSNGPGSTRQVKFYSPRNMVLNINGTSISIPLSLNQGSKNVTSTTNGKMIAYTKNLAKGTWYTANITWQRNSDISVSISP